MLNSDLVGISSKSGAAESRILCFGLFELDLNAGELRRNGGRVKLQDQPFQILVQLLEKPGEVVTRERLRARLWGADIFVDFDHSLNAAIRRLRDALGDSAENPRFVETVARRGYRFLAPVTAKLANDAGSPLPPLVEDSAPSPRPNRRLRWIAAGVAALTLILLGVRLGILLGREHSTPGPIRISQLTANPAEDRVRAAGISPDGRHLAFSDETGFYLRQIDSGETHPITLPEGMKAWSIGWFPDNDHMIVALTDAGKHASLWVLSAWGGNLRKLNDDGRSPAISPDGKEVAFIAGPHLHQQVWLMNADGSQPRPLAGKEGDFFGAVAWSPDSARLVCTRGRDAYGYGINGEIDTINVRGSTLTLAPLTVNKGMFTLGLDGPLAWTSDGRLIYSLDEGPPHGSDSNLWSVAVDAEGKQIGSPERLTSDSGQVFSLSITADGKHVAYLRCVPQPDVYVARLEGTELAGDPQRLTLDDRKDIPYDWTADGKEVIFTSDRTGTLSIYRQAIDQTVPEMLVRGVRPLIESRLSPDGSQLFYVESPSWRESNSSSPLMRVPLAGGAPQKIAEASWISNHQCARAPATICLFSVLADRTLTFFTFDPLKGKGKQIFQIEDKLPQYYNWTLSPDGTTLAIVKAKSEDQPRIRLVSLSGSGKGGGEGSGEGSGERWLDLEHGQGISSLDWAADSRSLWAASVGDEENALLNIDLHGHARVVWRPTKKSVGWAIPSRDGRLLALYVNSTSANVWMLERP